LDRPNLTVIASKRSNRSIIVFMNEAKFPLGHYAGGRMDYSGEADRAATVRAAGSDDKCVGSNGRKKKNSYHRFSESLGDRITAAIALNIPHPILRRSG